MSAKQTFRLRWWMSHCVALSGGSLRANSVCKLWIPRSSTSCRKLEYDSGQRVVGFRKETYWRITLEYFRSLLLAMLNSGPIDEPALAAGTNCSGPEILTLKL